MPAEDIAVLANDVLDYSRNRLLVNLRYLDTALSMHLRAVYDGSIGTDGSRIFYSPEHVLRTYRDSREEIARNYLHVVLHSVFMHPYLTGKSDHTKWDLACDIAVEASICEMSPVCARSPREDRERPVLKRIRRAAGRLTAERIYDWLVRSGHEGQELEDLRTVFSPDDHSFWYAEDRAKLIDDTAGSDLTGVRPDDTIIDPDKWLETARRIAMELETFAKVRGDAAGTLVQNIRAVTRVRYDYTEFLKQFAAMGEDIRPSEDEFDYIYYTYGLKRYGNMPLIEPLEYREDHRIRDFVIAIDTSGSVAGEEVQSFVRRTCEILDQQKSFFRDINIHIIQCDAEIQSDSIITCAADVDRYLETMEIRGLGGTDFRPVFRYVDRLIEDGAFRDLRGLIYFTDGLGTFPETKPAYKTAFVFSGDGSSVPAVPVWAIRLILSNDELQPGAD